MQFKTDVGSSPPLFNCVVTRTPALGRKKKEDIMLACKVINGNFTNGDMYLKFKGLIHQTFIGFDFEKDKIFVPKEDVVKLTVLKSFDKKIHCPF